MENEAWERGVSGVCSIARQSKDTTICIVSLSELKPLVFIRHLYNLGVAQIEGQFPAASVTVFCTTQSNYFLQLGIEHQHQQVPRNTLTL